MGRRFALIGHPVAGSLSPVLIGAAYGGRHTYELIDEPTYAAAFQRVAAYDGFNVTAPFKKDAFRALSEIGSVIDSGGTGCINAVVRRLDGHYEAYNTDIDGVVGALQEASVVSGGLALVVGAGGAAMAARAALHKMDFRTLIAARREEALLAVLPEGARRGEDYFLLDDPALRQLQPDVVVYTLPGSAPVPAGLPLLGAVVLEAEYRTPRLADCACRHYISGRRWLLHQAVTGYRLFTGEEPDVAAMEIALSRV